jgi:carboxypeptidase Taq
MSETRNMAKMVWEKAKRENDFAAFAPWLQRNIEHAKKLARLIGPDRDPMDTLLDEHEPGMTSQALDVFFANLRERIVPLLRRVQTCAKKIDAGVLQRGAPVCAQKKISALMMRAAGYDLSRGELRETEHPFSSSFGKYDSRITTHYHEDRFASSLFSVLHECGHSIYEQNKDDRIADTPLDRGVSSAIHESQSRFYENIVGRSRAFISFIFGDLKALLGGALADMTEETLYEAVNAVTPSLIRIEADELTYSLHIMVRYEIERLMMAENVDVMLLPGLWNEKMREYLGVAVPDDARGILQDVHWSQGLFGYFPSYALGSAYAAQILWAMRKDLDVDAALVRGNIAALTAWLAERLQRYGSMYELQELLIKATGEAFNPAHYIRYLEDKFTGLYGL